MSPKQVNSQDGSSVDRSGGGLLKETNPDRVAKLARRFGQGNPSIESSLIRQQR